MAVIGVRAPARLLGAAATSGATFVSAPELVERLNPVDPEAGPPFHPPAPAHLALHVMRDDLVSALLLAAAERDEGVRGTYLLSADADLAEVAGAARILRRMGHRIGTWIPSDIVHDSATPPLVSNLMERLAQQAISEVDVIAAVAVSSEPGRDDPDDDGAARTLAEIAERAGIPCWVFGSACGATEPRRPLFHARDTREGWSISCTQPSYELSAVAADRLTADLLPIICDAVARSACLYTLTPDLYA